MRIAMLVLLAIMPSSLPARTRYEAYEARNSVFTGQGGTKVTKEEVDFWTMGTPPRRYQVLGVIRDNRGTGVLHGKAVGSSAVVRMIKRVGGEAAIVISENSTVTGVYSSGNASAYGNQAYASGIAVPIAEKTIVLAVIKYLPDEPPAR